MEDPEAPEDPFASLAPSARRGARGADFSTSASATRRSESSRAAARWRVGVGASIVLLVAALAVAIVISAISQQSNRSTVRLDSAVSGTDGGAGNGMDDGAPAGTGTSPTGSAGGAVGGSGGAIIFVHVLGSVANPGLYELSDGSRVVDVIAAAGGLAENADQGGVNLARVVSDGEQLYVPAVGEVIAGGGAAGASGGAGAGSREGNSGSAATGAKVNLNLASSAELQALPRIGEAMAQRIIDYREANGRFSSIDDLRSISGIGEKTFEALKELVTV
ncbi:helix-hairpin-helix domain-containing protein [Leifsonia sp. A12D58]|uniref:helix-hairpin-helix domain-containing protein n=1 Tax=Leifsonia sp. A12D58 TaxID=3397674 RepID=UPI0039DF8134